MEEVVIHEHNVQQCSDCNLDSKRGDRDSVPCVEGHSVRPVPFVQQAGAEHFVVVARTSRQARVGNRNRSVVQMVAVHPDRPLADNTESPDMGSTSPEGAADMVNSIRAHTEDSAFDALAESKYLGLGVHSGREVEVHDYWPYLYL